ncbi:hypothetical protein T06_1318 [Trichinella sp. T6]|nr:hypothetical protein T06_1318 [Trichinella sp. T6]
MKTTKIHRLISKTSKLNDSKTLKLNDLSRNH